MALVTSRNVAGSRVQRQITEEKERIRRAKEAERLAKLEAKRLEKEAKDKERAETQAREQARREAERQKARLAKRYPISDEVIESARGSPGLA